MITKISLDADGDGSYPLTTYPIKARNPVRTFTPDEVENYSTHADFTAQQLGIYSQHDWTKPINKMKFNQGVDDAAENFEAAQAVNFADLAKQAQFQAQFSQLQSDYNNYFNKFFINRKYFTFSRLDWRDIINGNNLIESLIGIFYIPLVRIKSNIHYLECI